MKYLLLLIFPSIAFALTTEQITTRIDAIEDLRGVAYLTGNNPTNIALERKRIIDEKDEARLLELEAKVADYQALVASTVAVQNRSRDMVIGKKIYASIKVLNSDKGLSKVQKRQLRSDMAEIRDDLLDGDICQARAEIALLTEDGTVIQSGDIAKALAMIDALKSCN
jgi:hypothetical protein